MLIKGKCLHSSVCVVWKILTCGGCSGTSSSWKTRQVQSQVQCPAGGQRKTLAGNDSGLEDKLLARCIHGFLWSVPGRWMGHFRVSCLVLRQQTTGVDGRSDSSSPDIHLSILTPGAKEKYRTVCNND